MSEVFDLLRWANTLMFVLSALMVAHRAWTTWAEQPPGLRRLLVALVILFATLAYGSLEAYVTAVDGGWRIPAIIVAMLGIMHGLMSTRADPTL